MFACEYCNYVSIHKHNVTRHVKRHHANHATTTFSVQQNQMQTNRAPVTMSIGDNVGRAPTAPTTMYTEPIQIGTGPPKHVSMELYQKAVKAIFNWAKVHKNDVEEKNKLSEELHYEKVAKEALPIHINNNILKKISILRGVKKNHNMGNYPEEMIHCIWYNHTSFYLLFYLNSISLHIYNVSFLLDNAPYYDSFLHLSIY